MLLLPFWLLLACKAFASDANNLAKEGETSVSEVEAENKIFFNGQEGFEELFPEYVCEMCYEIEHYKEDLLIKPREANLVDKNLFHLCMEAEESRYSKESLAPVLKNLSDSFSLTASQKNTLTHAMGQRVLAAAIRSLETPESQWALFRRLSPEILSNSFILGAFSNFSCFEPCKLVQEVVKTVVVPALLETGSPQLIHSVFVARNYELDAWFIHLLLMKRPEIFADSLFRHDPKIFAALTVRNPLLPIQFDALASFKHGVTKKRKTLPEALIEPIVSFWIRSEGAIIQHLMFLNFAVFSGTRPFDLQGNELPTPPIEPVVSQIEKEFLERHQMISFLSKFTNTGKLVEILQTSLCLIIREGMAGSSSHSPLFELIRENLPYTTQLQSFEEIEAAFLAFNIKSAVWKLNFYQLLIPMNHPEVPEAIVKAKTDLLAVVAPTPYAKLEQIINFSAERTKELLNDADCDMNYMQIMAQNNNALSSTFDLMNLTVPEFFEAVKAHTQREQANFLKTFAHLIQPHTIKFWLESAEGRQFLRENPEIAESLPTLADFTAEDCEEFGIKLDRRTLLNVHSLSQSTVAQILCERECIFNDPKLVLHRVAKDCLIPKEHWPLVSIYAIMIEGLNERTEELFCMLKISEVYDLKSLGDSELLGLVSHWLVHMTWQDLWFHLASILPIFRPSGPRSVNFAKLEVVEHREFSKIRPLLNSRAAACKDSTIKRHFELLSAACTTAFSVNPFKFYYTKKLDAPLIPKELYNSKGKLKTDQELTDIALDLNAGVQEVLQAHLKGSELKRSVIMNRIQVMANLHADGIQPLTVQLDWSSGKYPFEDSFMMWLLQNRLAILRLIIARNLTPKKLSGNDLIDSIFKLDEELDNYAEEN